jgi:hypothetical protein
MSAISAATVRVAIPCKEWLMAVGVFFDGFSSTAEMLEVCREAELAGA